MPELRRDPIVDRWVIISTERGQRPVDFVAPVAPAPTVRCPFCTGHEADTPPEVGAMRDGATAPDTPGWSVRVVSNKYPALMIEGPLTRTADGVYERLTGVGAHEVFIESPSHDVDLARQPVAQIADILFAYRARILDLKRDTRFRYILVFKNHGHAAGATLEHPHTQLIATPVVPKLVAEELRGMSLHHQYTERCILCDMIEQELRERERIVCDNEAFLAYEPYAPRFPYETWIVPRTHAAAFELSGDDHLHALAACLKETLLRLGAALDSPPYNFVLHTAPCRDAEMPFFHWHVEIMPTLTKIAGFEWGSGFYINPTPPEEAARTLREVTIASAAGA